jgi:hypothetical protein
MASDSKFPPAVFCQARCPRKDRLLAFECAFSQALRLHYSLVGMELSLTHFKKCLTTRFALLALWELETQPACDACSMHSKDMMSALGVTNGLDERNNFVRMHGE